jgi:hypothetical protein
MDLIEPQIQNPLRHWYYAHKFRVLKKLIQNQIGETKLLVDVGAGSALFSRELLRNSSNLRVVAVDTGYELPKMVDLENRIIYQQNGKDVRGDIYLFNDVLEHVSDDVEMLKAYVSSAPAKARFIISVPAFMSLLSGHDVFLKHFRRYKKAEINGVTEKSGLKVLKSHYIYIPLFPIAWVIRKLKFSQQISPQMKDHGAVMNKLILNILNLDFILSRVLPFGVSIVVLAEKTES